jgi:hypothetical protein
VPGIEKLEPIENCFISKVGGFNFRIRLHVIEAKFIAVVLVMAVVSGDYQTRNSYP